MLAIIVPIPARLDELASRYHGGMANNGDQIPLAARLYTQDGKAVFLVVERDALNEAGEDSAPLSVGFDFMPNRYPLNPNSPNRRPGVRQA